MSTLLLTNDDGIHAPGLAALEKQLASSFDVWVIAPDKERSACSRAVTLDRPLRTREHAPKRIAVDGTPTDCVLLAFRSIMKTPPSIVVSGINRGYNLGEDLDYSGTVAAAAEGALQGATLSVAVSADADASSKLVRWGAQVTAQLVGALLEHGLPPGSYLNINLPGQESQHLRWTRQGNPLGKGLVVVAKDPRGKPYHWISERPDEVDPPPDTDRGAIRDGCISLSLLTLERSWNRPWSAQGLEQLEGYLVDDRYLRSRG